MKIQMQEILEAYRRLAPIPLEKTIPRIAREQPELRDAVLAVLNNHATKRLLTGTVEPVAKIEHRLIQGPEDQIAVRIYRPDSDDESKPVLLYFHGGGFVLGGLNSYDSSCRALCNAADCVVVSVAYRQAPENKFPAARDDAFTAYNWLISRARELGVDPRRIAVAGESAGGNLAALVCLLAKARGLPQPVHQLLIYPWVDSEMDTPSFREHAHAEPLNAQMMSWFLRYYLPDGIKAADPLAFPLQSDELQGLAPATVITAEIDPLCTQGELYAEKLRAHGVPVFVRCFEGVTHEFFGLQALVPEAREALKLAAENLQAAFDGLPFNEDSARERREELANLQLQMRT